MASSDCGAPLDTSRKRVSAASFAASAVDCAARVLLSAPLIVETQISRSDIDAVEIGQKAAVRLSSLNQRTTPVLEGTLVYVSADALTTQSNGTAQEIYIARIDLAPAELRRIRGFNPTPGMPAEVMIETSARTFAQYLIKPIEDSLSRAFRED